MVAPVVGHCYNMTTWQHLGKSKVSRSCLRTFEVMGTKGWSNLGIILSMRWRNGQNLEHNVG